MGSSGTSSYSWIFVILAQSDVETMPALKQHSPCKECVCVPPPLLFLAHALAQKLLPPPITPKRAVPKQTQTNPNTDTHKQPNKNTFLKHLPMLSF